MDEEAKAIARARDEAKGDKSDQPRRLDDSKPVLERQAQGIASRKITGPPAFPSTKRPKKV